MAESNIYNMSQQELMQALTPPKPADKGFFGNLFTRRLVNPLQEKLGMRESLADQMRREQIGASRLDAFQDLQGMQRDEQLRQQLIASGVDPATANSLPIDKVAEAVIARSGQTSTNVYGDLTRTNPLSGVQQVLSTAPTSVREYNFSRSQTQPPLRQQGYDEFIAQQKRRAQSTPSAVQTFEYLKKLDPSIVNYSPEDKQKLLFSIIRQDPTTAGKIAEAQEMARNGGLSLTPGEKTFDTAFAKYLVDYRTQGGRSGVSSQLKEFDEIIANLESSPGLITGRAISLQPRMTRPDISIDTQDRVEKIITQGLRVTLGAAFTEGEAKAFIDRSFNIMLPESINADRLRRVREAMEKASDQMFKAGAYYDEKGSMQGYRELPELLDLDKGMYRMSDYKSLNNEEVLQIMDDPSISEEEWNVLLKLVKMRKVQ